MGDLMDTIIKFINDNDTIVMTALFIMIILLTLAVIISDYISRKKSKKLREGIIRDNSDEGEFSINDENSDFKTEDKNNIDTNVPEVKPAVTEIKYVDEDSELEKTRAQIELKNLKEELIKVDKIERENKRLAELEKAKEIEVIDVDKDNVSDNSSNKIDEFERAQEENAIISIDQFNKISDKVYESNEEIQYKDEGNEPISIAELEKLYNSAKEADEVIIDEKNPSDIPEKNSIPIEEFKFKNSPIISPVYGINKDESLSNISVENTANLDKLTEEIRKTNEFLNALKELKKSLNKM